MDKITKYKQSEVLRCMMFADYIILVGESLEDVNEILDEQ